MIQSIVCHRNHPEWGYGVVRQKEEDPFGDVIYQVAFDHENRLQPAVEADLLPCLEDAEAIAKGQIAPIEIFQRKLLAGLIIGENLRTGSFMRSALKPLPHQVYFLDRVLSGGRLGHLAADDVGLGKTIEAGLLINHFYKESHPCKILILCPAGLVLQWQDEMLEHFNLSFAIAGKGKDFDAQSEPGWKSRTLVIGSIDTFKQDDLFSVIRNAGPFDLVICDEAHRLSARRDFISGELRTTASFRFIRKLQENHAVRCVNRGDGSPRSPQILLLSATPHQGDNLRFAYLLGLIRPDLFPSSGKQELEKALTRENLTACLTKTAKDRAIDWEGKPIFRGHTTQTLSARRTIEEEAVGKALSHYLRKSMEARHGASRSLSLVIELVMHTFHKIAASSWTALETALAVRLAALRGEYPRSKGRKTAQTDSTHSDEGIQKAVEAEAFYEGEDEDLDILISQIRGLREDSKLTLFLETIRKIEAKEKNAKVLIFTQYYATQDLLLKQLSLLFPGQPSVIVNGKMGVSERQAARRRFEKDARFLVSTEAGGEGVNFQKACHTMINYDLPWNPMRLQQRIGRLDRYGQKQVVKVFNLMVEGSWDDRITTRIVERLKVIQTTMADASEHPEDYWEMILGEVGDAIDPIEAFKQNMDSGKDMTDQEIDDKLREANEAMQSSIARHLHDTGFSDLSQLPLPTLGPEHYLTAFKSLLSAHDIQLRAARTSTNEWLSGVFQFEPPSEFRETGLRATKSRYIVFDKERYNDVRDQVIGRAKGQDIKPQLAGFGEAFNDWLFESVFAAKTSERLFSLKVNDWSHGSGWLKIAALRWRGERRQLRTPDTLLPIWIGSDGVTRELETAQVIKLLENSNQGEQPSQSPPSNETGKELVQRRLKDLVSLNPESRLLAGWSWLAIAWVSAPN